MPSPSRHEAPTLPPPLQRSLGRRPKIGARTSIALHVGVMLLCAVAIRADTATSLAWGLLVLNGIGGVLAALSRRLDESR